MMRFLFGLALFIPGLACAQPAPPSSTQAFQQSMTRMHHDMMAVPYTGDADRDFVAGMIPHHQGAIDMARIELRDGHDPALRHLAENIIRDQAAEIAFMRDWQAKHAR